MKGLSLSFWDSPIFARIFLSSLIILAVDISFFSSSRFDGLRDSFVRDRCFEIPAGRTAGFFGAVWSLLWAHKISIEHLSARSLFLGTSYLY